MFTVMVRWRVGGGGGLSCEPGGRLRVLYHFGGWGCGYAREAGLGPLVIHYFPLRGGGSVVVLCCLFLVSEFM